MGRGEDIIIRIATKADSDFIIEAILQAEKSGTDRCALLKLWNCNENQLRTYLRSILDEEIDGTEWSIDNFVIAESSGHSIGAFAGWIEGENEWGLSSSTLKANLMKACLPIDVIVKMSHFQTEIQAVQIPRTQGALQLEYAYVVPGFQGKGVIQRIVEFIFHRYGNWSLAEVQVFANNSPAIQAYSKLGFVRTFETKPTIEDLGIFPYPIKLKMTKNKP
ncbi:MAG: hypothetical protein RL106_942 [Bacteroidota bacterium]